LSNWQVLFQGDPLISIRQIRHFNCFSNDEFYISTMTLGKHYKDQLLPLQAAAPTCRRFMQASAGQARQGIGSNFQARERALGTDTLSACHSGRHAPARHKEFAATAYSQMRQRQPRQRQAACA
jgi:hypothetical protein